MNISTKQFLAILFLSLLATNDLSAILSEKQKEAFSGEQLYALMVKIAPVTLTVFSALILGLLVVRSKNKTIAQQYKTILEQSKIIENQNGTMSKIEQLKTLAQNFLSKTVSDCSDEKGLNLDTAFIYINNNILFLNKVFDDVLHVEGKAFLTNFARLISAVEDEYMQTSAVCESLKYGKKIVEEENQKLLQEIKENRCEIGKLKSANDGFIDFVLNRDVHYLFENFVTSSPVTYDLMYLIHSKTFQKHNLVKESLRIED